MAFAPGEQRWRSRLGSLRQVVRQELVARQLTIHLPAAHPRRVLDIGCGQGTQALRLARAGHRITGVDSSATLLADFEAALAGEAIEVRSRASLLEGDALDLTAMFEPASFDAILCHGLLMYVPRPEPLLAGLAGLLADGGMVSLLVRNGDALAMRPGLQGDWTTARTAFDNTAYVNRMGINARADRLSDLTASLAGHQLQLRAWYGVRVFTDAAAVDAKLPDQPTLEALLACEEQAGARDPYRAVAALTHLIADHLTPT